MVYLAERTISGKFLSNQLGAGWGIGVSLTGGLVGIAGWSAGISAPDDANGHAMMVRKREGVHTGRFKVEVK
jgi:hypothetical protein